MLRKRLGKLGVATSDAALAGLLTSEASAAVPETLLPTILATVKTALATTATATGGSGGKDYAPVSVAIKRFEQRLQTDRTSAELQRKLVERLNVET